MAWYRCVFLVCCLVLAWPVASSADSTPIPDDGLLPWTDPDHQSPLEVLAGRITSKIAGRTVGVRCEGETDWQTLSAQNGADADGFVRWDWQWNGSGWSMVTEGFSRLSPHACSYLKRFAVANPKPTKCAVPEKKVETVYQTVRYKTTVPVKVKKRVRVKGKWVIKTVVVKKTVWKTKQKPRSVTTITPGAPEPCYAPDNESPWKVGQPDYWEAYYDYAYSLGTLVHEASHLGGDLGGVVPDGYPSAGQVGYPDFEARAECHEFQWIAYAAEQLGDTADDAQAIARYAFERIYPRLAKSAPEYWTADCHANGPLDLTPGDGVWP